MHRLRRALRPELAVFQKHLDSVAAKSQAAVPGAAQAASGLERIIHADDLLKFDWVSNALAAGESVARLITPRYENGRAILGAGGAKPVESLGAGWVFAPGYIITNHHVANSRSESEPIASGYDLNLQAKSTKVQFDFDREGAEGEVFEVESLVAWYSRNAQPALDFAILKLAQPCPRAALVLALNAVPELKGKPIPVNIIQHPGARPRRLAFAII